MRANKRTLVLIASLAAVLCLFGVAYAALPLIPGGEQVNIRLNRLLRNITNADKGSVMIAAAKDDWQPLSTPSVDGYTLQWDTVTGLPVWADPAVPPTDPILTSHGGTGLASYTQGDLIYYTSSTAFSKLAKSVRPAVSLRNTGASNAPAWGPVQTLIYFSTQIAPTHTGTTAAETTLTPASAEGTATIPVADLLAGARFPFTAALTVAGDADGDETLTINVYAGTQLLATSGAIADDGATKIYIEGEWGLWTSSATSTGNAFGMIINGTTLVPFNNPIVVGDNFDGTATKAFTIKADWGGTTDAADTVILNSETISVNNVD